MSEKNQKDLIRSKSSLKKKIEDPIKKFNDIYKAEDYVRSLPQSLTDKIKILNNNPRIKELRANERKYNATYHLKKPYTSLVSSFKSLIIYLSPFNRRIASVEKNLGLDVASYFSIYHWLIHENLITFVFIILPFLCIPHIVMLALSYQSLTKSDQMTKINVNGSCYEYSLNFEAIDILTGEVYENFYKKILLKCSLSQVHGTLIVVLLDRFGANKIS